MVDACSESCTGNSRNRLIEEKIPDWLIQASAHRRLALRRAPVAVADWYRTASEASHATLAQAIKTAWLSQSRLDRVFEPLADVRRFAEPLLQKALKDRFGVELDVSRTFLRLYLPTGIVKGYQVKTLSLLDAALHNFEMKESAANYFDSASCFISEPDTRGHFNVLSINERIGIDVFISICRDLDIGGQYSQQLEAILLPKDAVAKAGLEYRVKSSQKDAFRAAVLLARMKGDIGADSQALLLRLLDGVRRSAMHCYQLQIMTARLTGIMLLAGDLERSSRVEPLLVYIPDDPQHPIKEYPSTLAFKAVLTEQLRSPAYQRFFARFIAHEQRGAFFAALDQQLNAVKWHPPQPADPRPAWRNTPIDKPVLRFHVHKVQSDPWQWLYQGALNKILNDARTIAVPTADEDRQSRWAFWDSVQRVASIILQVATLVVMPFVPFAGELMLAYTAYQLLDETFTGILDWAEGQVAEAADHLLGIAENLAQLAAFGTAAAVVGRVLAVKPSAFVEGLKPVILHDSRTRLWSPDLAPYEQPLSLPTGGATDELGLEHHAGKTFLTLESRTYEVAVDPDSSAYHVLHPERPNAYRPRLTHNGEGAWAHEVERPMEWQGAQLFRRLGHSVAEFSDETARRILTVSGIDEAMLRHLHVHAHRPPALLEDTIRRFKLDQRIQVFREQMLSSDPDIHAKAEVQLQKRLLQMQQVSLPEGQSGDGHLLEALWDVLDEREQKHLLGLSPAPDDPLPARHVRATLLRKRMARWTEEFRTSLFTFMEEVFESAADMDTQQMRRIFPDLPRTIAQELWREASAAERLHLLNRPGMPRRIAHEALFYLRELRLNRACEGLYLHALSSADTDRLALHMLESLEGWKADIRLEVRDGHFEGLLLDSIGAVDTPIRKVLVRRGGLYEAHDERGELLHGPDDLFGAIQHALPQTWRDALDLPHVGQGRDLEQALRRLPLLPRPEVRALFGQPPLEPGSRSPMRLAIGRTGYLLGGGDSPPAEAGSITQRLRRLFPTLDEEQLDIMRREHLSGDPSGAVARLEGELLTLVNDLETWAADVPAVHPLTGTSLNAGEVAVQRQRRTLFAQTVQASWRRQLTDHNRFDTDRFYSRLDMLGELPKVTADFSHVSEFLLINDSPYLLMGDFLENFPNLRFLALKGLRLDRFPGAALRMRELVSLSLEGCHLRLDEASVDGLAHMERLERLDLDNNPLGVTLHVGHMKGLEELRLRSTELTVVPEGLFDLEKLRYADLSGNQIVELPDELFEVEDVREVEYNFADNPLSESSKIRIAAYDENSSLDRKLLIQVDDGVEGFSESESSSDSEVDDSGVGSPSEVSDEEN
ncbi:MAG: leucine-rich repeat domain-containing protein [Pseudomonas fluorescens]|nr:leucine-rich repeat domain-containing protein [Pseudomonas fluorescens]